MFLCLFMNAKAADRPIPLDANFLKDYAATRGFRLGRPAGLQVTPAGDAVLFLRSGPRSPRQALFLHDVEHGTTREWITPDSLLGGRQEDLSPEEKARRERMRMTAGGIATFQLSEDGAQVLVPLGERLFLVERATGSARELRTDGPAFDPKLSPDARWVGFIRDHDVWVHEIGKDRNRRITRGGTEAVSHGEAEFVAAEEMYRYTGWWWAPDSRSILFEEVDARGVEEWFVADPAHPEQAPRPQFYPRPGHSNVVARLGIISIRGGRPVWVDWDTARLPYFTRADWHRQGGLTICVQSRDQREVRLLRVDPGRGTTTPLVTEGDPLWVNLDPQMPRWLEDGSGFLWTTERTGAWQLELHHPDGSLDHVLTPSTIGYQGFCAIDNARHQVVYAASQDPTQTQIWRASLNSGVPERLTMAAGVHSAVFARNAPVWVLTSATPDSMPRSFVRHGNRGESTELPSVAEEPGFQPGAESLFLETDPGFYAEVIRPRQFRAGQRYPVLVDVYGGPHANVVQASMATRLLPQWLADRGFIVVSLDNRGTPRRGRDWERSIYQRFAEVPLEDQVAGLKALGARFPELDLQRVGIVGWSFGGYMSALAVLRRPDVFRAAVAGAPVTDWMDYDTHYTERYLGVPKPGESVYAANSLIDLAAHLDRPLLILHGTGDDNVFFRHSLKLAGALFRAGRPFEILPLPGLTHMVPDPVMMERQWGRTAEFFLRHLRQGVAEPAG